MEKGTSTTNLIKIKGKNPGSTSIILAGVHGDEKAGVHAVNHFLKNPQIDAGILYIGIANPQAVEHNIRFTEANLNRLFLRREDLSPDDLSSYEFSRCEILKKYLDQSFALLDLHASSNPATEPFIICEESGVDIARALPARLIVSGFDEHEPGGTDFYMNKAGKIGICFEAGYSLDPKAEGLSKQAIQTFLIAQGHIQGENKQNDQIRMNIFKKYYSKTNQFQLQKTFKDFEKLKKR